MKTLAEYLTEKGIDSTKVIVEYKGEIHAPGTDLSAVAYTEGDPVEIFRVVAGG